MSVDSAKWQAILELDLTGVRDKFLYRKSWWWKLWHGGEANMRRIEAEYRQFLYLIAANPGKTVVPWNQELDDFWHEHILDTRKYDADCQKVFGSLVHHNPHLPKGSTKHTSASKDTKEMYRESFCGDVADFTDVGCVGIMPNVFPVPVPVYTDHSPSHHNHAESHHYSDPTSDHSSHDSGSHDSGSHSSCGSSCSSASSCSSGSSCGSSCGGGGGCGGGCGGGD